MEGRPSSRAFLPRVFRLRRIPHNASSRDDVARILSLNVPGVAEENIRICSLATSLQAWESLPSKVATLMFRGPLPFAGELEDETKSEWTFPLGGLTDSLVLDTHFLGLTPLNDVSPQLHHADCIMIGGLGSHPFGSWQPRGSDKSFMWARDDIPRYLPGIRICIYGYDTKISGSNSYQTIPHLARKFVQQLETYGWDSRSAKPLAFLAHSMGGVLLKEAILNLGNNVNDQGHGALGKIRGAIFFGVPSLGMEQSHLMAMVEGQANEQLIQDLSRYSGFLREQDKRFSIMSANSQMKLFWLYETSESPTVVRNGDLWDRSGPMKILVDPVSATCRLIHTCPELTIAIDRNHSDLIKLNRDDPDLDIIISKLREILRPRSPEQTPISVLDSALSFSTLSLSAPGALRPWFNEPEGADMVRQSLDAPELSLRVSQINKTFKRTFEWIFDHDGFTDWLTGESGIFWISGKPGCGKSTLMKFVYQHPRTWELRHQPLHSANEITVGFFIHYQGSFLQKSFEGLLRSIIVQILDQCPELYRLLTPVLAHKGGEVGLRIAKWTISELEHCLNLFLDQHGRRLDICFFLDALDEFVGHTEMICRFIHSVVRPRRGTLTKTKLCFSSRPGDPFAKHFSQVPGFSLQDQTKLDIRDFCLGSISIRGPATALLRQLVPEIVEKSQGVFIWVSHVVDELSLALASGRQTPDQLRILLKSFPASFDEYYRWTVRRIPQSKRWETYVILELIVHASQVGYKIALDELLLALDCADCATYQAGSLAAMATKSRLGSDRALAEGEKRIRASTGELVEVLDGGTPQLMHHTVYDFATGPSFQGFVLGDLARITTENGHSFLFKYFLLRSHGSLGGHSTSQLPQSRRGMDTLQNPAYHARQAEVTQGHASTTFIDSIPATVFSDLGFPGWTGLGFAAFASLTLYLRETARLTPDRIPNSQESLLSNALMRWEQEDNDAILDTIRTLLDAGYPISRDRHAIQTAILFDDPGRPDLPISFDTQASARFNVLVILLEHAEAARVDVDIQVTPYLVSTAEPGRTCKILHLAPPAMATWLLDRGTDPNCPDSHGSTPLDYALGAVYGADALIPVLHERCSILIARGGRARHASESVWQNALAQFARLGLPVADLREL